MRTACYVVTRNEAGRYLRPCLERLTRQFDAVVVYDDNSTDGTPDIARHLGCIVGRRTDDVPTFMEHEGKFRQAAWDFMADAADLERDDWVLAIDADEFLMHDRSDERKWLKDAAEHAGDATSILIQKHEVFGTEYDGNPLVRIDGFWGQIIGTRYCRYLPDGKFADKKMASGCEPTYASVNPHDNAYGLYLLHYGYATQEDRQAKYLRYTSLPNNGHNDSHIQSIVQPGALRPFWLPYPDEMHPPVAQPEDYTPHV